MMVTLGRIGEILPMGERIRDASFRKWAKKIPDTFCVSAKRPGIAAVGEFGSGK